MHSYLQPSILPIQRGSRSRDRWLSLLMLWSRISIRVRYTTFCDKVYQWLATGWWFSPGSPVFCSNITDRHDKTMHTHYHIDPYGLLRFPSENTVSITHSENTTCITVNDVTMQKASLLKRSLNVSFLSNLLSFFSVFLFQTPQIWKLKNQFNALSILEWINHTCLTPCWCGEIRIWHRHTRHAWSELEVADHANTSLLAI